MQAFWSLDGQFFYSKITSSHNKEDNIMAFKFEYPTREEIIAEFGVPKNVDEFQDETDWQLYWLIQTAFGPDSSSDEKSNG